MSAGFGLDCWVCGAPLAEGAPLIETVAWVRDHEHTRIEREAARIVKTEDRRADREARRGY